MHARHPRPVPVLSGLSLATLATLAAILAVMPAPLLAGDLTGNCRLANQPAATLLIPYFEVDLDNLQGATTLVSVNNSAPRPALARVVLWTDWGVPTLAFDVYLTGYDVQTINLRDVFTGALPVTGPAVSPSQPPSESGPPFAGCGTSAVESTPVGLTQQAFLRAAHSGRRLPDVKPAQCAASFHAPGSLLTGYMTVDVVNRCSPPSISGIANTPADPTYFAKGGTGLASDDNVLWGDVFYVNAPQKQAASQPALALLADKDFFQPGSYTFYGRYNGFNSSDDRMPLSSLYYVRFFDGGPFTGGTDLLVWRDTRIADASSVPCGTAPSWSPPGEEQIVFFDEQENAGAIPDSNAFPVATQRVHVGSPSLSVGPTAGWLMLDLWRQDGTHTQGWVGSLVSLGGRFSSGHEALRADDLCNFGP